MNNESILVEYTLYLITDQSLVSSILMIFCTTIHKCLENDSKADMFNILALNCCGLKNKLQYPEFQEILSDILSLKQLLFRSLKSVLSLFTLLLKHLLFKLLNSKSVLSQLRTCIT
jgi:hypothetical protein